MMKIKLIVIAIITCYNLQAQVWNSHTKMSTLLPKAIADTIYLDSSTVTINYLEITKSDTLIRGWEHSNLQTGVPIDRCWISASKKISTTIMFWPNGNTLMIKENLPGIQSRNTFFYENGLVQMIYYYDAKGLNGKHLVFDEQGDLETYSIYKKDKLKRTKFQKKK